jgi:hypothetical protein
LSGTNLLLAAAVAGAVLLGGSALAVLVLIRLPATYFVHPRRRFMEGNHRVVRWVAIVAKNLLGAILVLVGIGLSVPGIPGPGIVTLLVGVALLDFPGKRALEYRAIRHPSVLRAINALRRRFSAPPLLVESPEARSGRRTSSRT